MKKNMILKIASFIAIVGVLVSTAMWIDCNIETLALIPTLFTLPKGIILIWAGIFISLGCIFIASLPTDDDQEEEIEEEEPLDRAHRIMRAHQEAKARGEKRHLQIITLQKKEE